VNSPPGMFLKDTEMYDRVEYAERGYAVKGLMPNFLAKQNVEMSGGKARYSCLYILC
jgi:hypothetical protein